MAITGDNTVAIIAGGSGLVGGELVKLMLEESAIGHLYALVRKPLHYFHPKLELIQDSNLEVKQWEDDNPRPTVGFICLGSTLKQAGSKEALAQVDYQLVCDVAQQMKLLGVKRLAVVSSVGASPRSLSHYLKCKGRMEATISRMGFEQVTFVRPGPLKGIRDEPRWDESVVQSVLKILRPIMVGPLGKFIPIRAEHVAQAMLYSVFDNLAEITPAPCQRLDSIQMRKLLERYR
ncbi:NAD(P)H-binding protein [Vibrio sp.]|uniref:NAD(P)H-binding protein n=1 Tax=Vibrio sp. TaxID=678 RepID=UPI003D0FEDAD